ncbi:carboxylesterase type B [Bradyrhizobium sp. LB1.3]
MRYVFALFAASVILCCNGSAVAQPVGQFPFALTREGQMLGAVEGEVASFKGLAYAAAPIGPLRWRPPQATAESSEMRTAYKYGAPCLQSSLPGASEDCLTLNVFRPFGVDGPLPVMLFIHGGAFVRGTANDPLFDGGRLAQAGLIVVTVNFRLGALGWLTEPALSEGGSGNYGLMDQIAALHWVHDNIAAFGGDPNNVTLFGSGAGATSIALLMLCAQSPALFQKAILQSVPGRARLRSAQEAEIVGRQFVAALGQQADLRVAEPRGLLAAEKHLLEKSPRSFAPTIDGRLVSEEVAAGFAAGRESRIPMIIGSNDDETGFDSELDIREELAIVRYHQRRTAQALSRPRQTFGPRGKVLHRQGFLGAGAAAGAAACRKRRADLPLSLRLRAGGTARQPRRRSRAGIAVHLRRRRHAGCGHLVTR